MPEPVIQRVVIDTLALPRPASFASVEVRRITIPPGLTAGAHLHNGPVFGVIESGSAHVQIADGDDQILGPGDTFHEPADTVITRFDATDEGVVFLAWFPMPAGVEPTLTAV